MKVIPHNRVVRSVAVGLGAVGCLAALPIWGESLLVAGLLAFGAVVATGRSMLRWLGDSEVGKLLRRLIRVGLFFAPLPFAPAISWSYSAVAVAVAVSIGLGLRIPDVRDLRVALNSATVAALPPRHRMDAVRDLIVAGGSGVAQEYLYRGLLLFGLASFVGWWAVPVTAALFVLEHVAHGPGGHSFDRRDIAVLVVLSLALGTLTLLSGSVLPAMIGHTVYNLPGVAMTIRRAFAPHPERSLQHG